MDAPRARALLAAERARATTRLAALEREVAAIVAQVASESPDDEHDPEGATTGFERARAMRLRDDALARLAAVDDAEGRVAAGTWGTCTVCGGAVPDARLEARPTARTCVRCAATHPTT